MFARERASAGGKRERAARGGGREGEEEGERRGREVLIRGAVTGAEREGVHHVHKEALRLHVPQVCRPKEPLKRDP